MPLSTEVFSNHFNIVIPHLQSPIPFPPLFFFVALNMNTEYFIYSSIVYHLQVKRMHTPQEQRFFVCLFCFCLFYCVWNLQDLERSSIQ